MPAYAVLEGRYHAGLGFHISLNRDEFQHLAPSYKLPNYKHWLNPLLVLCHKYGTQSATVGTSQLCQYQQNHNEAELNVAPIANELAHGIQSSRSGNLQSPHM